MSKAGTALVAIGYLLLSVSALLGLIFISNYPHEIHEHQVQIATPWALTNQLVVGFLGAWLVYSHLRNRSKAAFVVLAACATILLLVRLRNDASCFGALHEHGCHTFLAAIILVFVGLMLSAKSILDQH